MVRFPIGSSSARLSHRSVHAVQVALVFDVLADRDAGPDLDLIPGAMALSGLMMQVTGTCVRIWSLAMKVWKDRRETEVSGCMGMVQGDFHRVHLPDDRDRLVVPLLSSIALGRKADAHLLGDVV